MSSVGVSVEEKSGVVYIRLERPERRNAYDIDMAKA